MGPLAAVLLAAIPVMSTPAPAADDLRSLPAPAAGVTRVYLVRHAQALSNVDHAPDLKPEDLDHLTSVGKQQAAAAGRALAALGVDAVLVSPARRAQETAKELAAAAGASAPVVETRLQSLQLGKNADGHDLTWPEREAVLKSGRDPSPAGGESMEAVAARVDALVRGLARRADPKPVVLVSHGEVIAAWLGRLRGIPSWKRYPPGIANGAVAVVDVTPDGRATVRRDSFVSPLP
jgi:broad specificity phosphatase PhoE